MVLDVTYINYKENATDMTLLIQRSTIDLAIAIEREIPEFDNPYDKTEYERRLSGANPLILVATVDNVPAGYKVGYDRYRNGSYYSWVGGVLPEYRGRKIANLLADEQEEWAAAQGYNRMILKTKPKYENMLAFAQKRGFVLINVDATEEGEVLVLQKTL